MPPPPDPPRFDVRAARTGDAESICHVHVGSIRVLCARDYTDRQIEAWAGPKRPEDYVRAMDAGETIYVAEAQGEILGFACRSADELRGLYVAPTAVRRGVGTALLECIEAEAGAEGIQMLRLQSTLTAASFYRARGYVADGLGERLMGGVAIPCVPMHKPLIRQS